MRTSDTLARGETTRNQEGCPYLHQTGFDAVKGWACVLASIDPLTLPPEMKAELQWLQHTRTIKEASNV